MWWERFSMAAIPILRVVPCGQVSSPPALMIPHLQTVSFNAAQLSFLTPVGFNAFPHNRDLTFSIQSCVWGVPAHCHLHLNPAQHVSTLFSLSKAELPLPADSGSKTPSKTGSTVVLILTLLFVLFVTKKIGLELFCYCYCRPTEQLLSKMFFIIVCNEIRGIRLRSEYRWLPRLGKNKRLVQEMSLVTEYILSFFFFYLLHMYLFIQNAFYLFLS